MVTKSAPTTTSINSFERLDAVLLEVANHTVIIAQCEAQMNKRMQDIRDKFETDTADVRTKKAGLEAEIEIFCINNKHEFEKTRSRELVHGVVGFRNSNPKVALLSRKYNWKTVIELLKRIFKDAYVRTKEEVDKEAILADYAEKKLKDDKLASVGIRVEQDENFYYDIKWEELKDKAA